MKNLLERDREHIWHPFSPVKGGFPLLPLKSSEGVYLITEDDRKIIDGIGSWWVTTLGHSHPEIAETLYHQAKEMAHVIFANFTHQPAVDLSEQIKQLIPGQSKVFFSDNGSTAIEVALKIALQYWTNLGKPRKKIIALEGAYHGDTFGAMSVAERNAFSAPFNDKLFDVEFLPFPHDLQEEKCVAQCKEWVETGDVACFIFEPLVQGASGMRFYSPATLEKLISIAHENDVICIADEIFTGFYRTGKAFATQHTGIEADIYCLSKGLTAGTMALGLTTVNQRIFDAFNTDDITKVLYHGHSFTGNPLACAVALKSLEILHREEIQMAIQHISMLQKEFVNSIKGHSQVKVAESFGTIMRIEINTPKDTDYFNDMRKMIYDYFLDRNILLRPLGNVVYYLPPYITEVKILQQVYKEIRGFLDHLKNY